ncbi:MAG TPA: Ig-like domain-containing protein, partial [bacterium]|nr:Ig-like domain-containing protein [bacterium]
MDSNHARIRAPGSGPLRSLGALAMAALLAVPLGIGGCSDDDDNGTGPDTDTTAPTVQSVTPADGATGVSVNTTIQVVFSEPVDPATITPATMSLQGSPGSLTVNGATVTYTPASFLLASTLHTCNVTTGVKDKAGNAMASAYSWSFTTGSQPVADAGDDLDVSLGEAIFLDGTGSVDPDGDPLATYTWTQVHGPVVTVTNANTATPAIQSPPTVVSTLGFELVVTTADETSAPDRIDVRILEDSAHQLWVAPNGDDTYPGTRAQPMATVQAAIDASAADGMGADVYVAAGTYAESLTMASGVSLYGGFDDVEWLRDIPTYDTVIQGGRRAIYVNQANDLTIDGLTVLAASATSPGVSSVVIGLSESQAVTITRNRLTAGNGADGAAGPAGQVGQDGPAGLNGSGTSGGLPGNGLGHDGGKGGNGASGLSTGGSGWTGGGPLGGVGGSGGSVGYWGDPGSPGGNGVGGSSGSGGPAFNAVGFGDYSPGDGWAGVAGGHGCGGGGGGGG